MGDISRMPATTTMTVEQALAKAQQDDLEEVIVIGRDGNGDLIVRSSRMTCETANWVLDLAKNYTLGHTE